MLKEDFLPTLSYCSAVPKRDTALAAKYASNQSTLTSSIKTLRWSLLVAVGAVAVLTATENVTSDINTVRWRTNET